jgi:peroxiredoxin
VSSEAAGCPFCTAQLRALQAAEDESESVGATLAVVTPETRDFRRQLKASLGLALKVLSDVDYGAALSYGALFRVPTRPEHTIPVLGFDFSARHGSSIWMLSIPATYVIDTDGRIRSVFIEPHFTMRGALRNS